MLVTDFMEEECTFKDNREKKEKVLPLRTQKGRILQENQKGHR